MREADIECKVANLPFHSCRAKVAAEATPTLTNSSRKNKFGKVTTY